MSHEFIWSEMKSFSRERGKMMLKVPMRQEIITEDGELWKYYFENDQIQWQFMYYVQIFTATLNID